MEIELAYACIFKLPEHTHKLDFKVSSRHDSTESWVEASVLLGPRELAASHPRDPSGLGSPGSATLTLPSYKTSTNAETKELPYPTIPWL